MSSLGVDARVKAGCAGLAAAAVHAAARVSGAVADAVITVDTGEHERRRGSGLRGVHELGLLDALMCLPLGEAIPVADVGDVALDHLRAAPAACVTFTDDGTRVQRQLAAAANVELVIVRAAGWRGGLRRAAAFEPFATRVVLLDHPPRAVSDIAWQADAAGVGLWIRQPDQQVTEVVAPAPFVRRYVKPAGWRFTERAYSAWVAAGAPVSATAR